MVGYLGRLRDLRGKRVRTFMGRLIASCTNSSQSQLFIDQVEMVQTTCTVTQKREAEDTMGKLTGLDLVATSIGELAVRQLLLEPKKHFLTFESFLHSNSFCSPRLFITETFENCVASSRDLTFECGPLLPKTASGILQKNFDIETLEVWGVGGDEVVSQALGARHEQREITAANIRKARKVDKAAFLDDFQSGLIESKAFAHRGQMRGRADPDAGDDKYKNKYSYEN